MYGRSSRDPDKGRSSKAAGSSCGRGSANQISKFSELSSDQSDTQSRYHNLGSELYDSIHRRQDLEEELEPLIQRLTTGADDCNISQVKLVIRIYDKLTDKARDILKTLDRHRDSALATNPTGPPTKKPARSKGDIARASGHFAYRREIVGHIDTLTNDKTKFENLLECAHRPDVFARKMKALWLGMNENPLYGPRNDQ